MSVELIYGDCLEKMKDIPDNSIDMILADMPYGITACKWDSVIPLELLWKQLERITKINSAIVLHASQPFTTILISSNISLFKYCWYWDKIHGTNFLNARKQPLKSIEEICIFYKKQCVYNPQMRFGKKYTSNYSKTLTSSDCYGKLPDGKSKKRINRLPLSLIRVSHDTSKIHPTQKPIGLLEYLIKTYTNISATVLDFCIGSGSTGIACQNLNRNFIGIEKDKHTFKVAKLRLK